MKRELDALESLNQVAARVTFLSEAGRELASSIDLEETFGNLGDVLVPAIADVAAVMLVNPGEQPRPFLLKHVNPDKDRKLREMPLHYLGQVDPEHGMPHVLKTGKAELVRYLTETRFLPGSIGQILVKDMGVLSYLALPLRMNGKQIIGGLWLGTSEESGRRFSAEDLRIGRDVAALAAQAVHNAALHEAAVGDVEKLRVLQRIREEYILREIHDVKTPLTAASLLIQLIARGSSDPYVDSGAKKAIENIERAVTMINNLNPANALKKKAA
jgi:GAF domain-containing protein